MTNVDIFTDRADHYARSRPAYAPQAVELILSLCPPGGAIADVGAGTGILSRQLLPGGAEIYAVEPNAAMRAHAVQLLGSHPRFHPVCGSAEHTTLPDHCVSLVTAASAFHWFDAAAFGREAGRILTANGLVCLLLNVRITDDFTAAQHRLCRRCCPGYTSLTHSWETTLARADDFFAGDFTCRRFSFPLFYTKEKFIARSLSSSFAPESGTAQYRAYADGLRRLLEDAFPSEQVRIANETVLLWGSPR